ncbi:hypothetical protein FE374_07280 [Georgenia yuyongxinii]|uniref:Protein RecA n=1 Tax=Georgenia yuyongxinii TaxID=2589797 RepID=A0A5B8C1G9_9MICO|nr:hypothetical protein [Georgenia yuyongxinii]QDC24453.1 hypothetical protein FE374_07280 [Georgenia yuyongxinii]
MGTVTTAPDVHLRTPDDPGGSRPAPTGPPGRPADPAGKLAAARAALTRAELAAGLRTRLAGPTVVGTSPALVAVSGGAVSDTAAPLATVATGAGPVPGDDRHLPVPGDDRHLPVPGDDRHLPVPGVLAPLFPGGALARGSVVQVTGSTSVLLALAGAASADGAWCALAAMPDVGWRAAAAAGLAPERVAVVPAPGPDAAAVVGALADGFDVLVVGRCPALGERDRRLLGSRLRTRGAVLLSTHPWPGAQLVLRATVQSWDGLGQGWGHLARQELAVRATGRAGATRAREVRVHLGTAGLLVPVPGAPSSGLAAVATPASSASPDEAPLLQAV